MPSLDLELPMVDHSFSQLQPLLGQLPPHHSSTLDALLHHLAKVASLEQQNKMSVRNLALVFGPMLVHPSTDKIE